MLTAEFFMINEQVECNLVLLSVYLQAIRQLCKLFL